MYLLLIYFILNSFLMCNLFGRYIGTKGANLFTVTSLLLANLLSFFIFYEVAINKSPVQIHLYKWIDLDLINLDFTFKFDFLSSAMLIVITSISLCAHLYSVEYMNTDPHQIRFMSYLSLFTFFMVILVTSDNFYQLFLGWEGVGICSYLLINFWFTRLQANKSALKAMFTNKISDICLSIGIFFIFFFFKSYNFNIIFASINYLDISNTNLYIICLLLLIGAIGKSAQIGLHVWLPDAMEGPTPVSSLIHAATMVTAGIFLIIRCSYLFEYVDNIFLVIIIIGALTAFFSSTTGLFQNDIKKVVAYSTCSQLGYMFFICGFSQYQIGFFHLFNHAFFKALLFLTAGALIHNFNNEQDIRNMGGFIKIFPFLYICILIGSLSLMGFPFLTGFYSKDLIIESTYIINFINYNNYNIILNILHGFYWLLVISIIFTALYSLRVIFIVFFEKYKGTLSNLLNIHYSGVATIIPLFYLSLYSIFIGYLTKDLFVGVGTDIWFNSIFNFNAFIDYEFINVLYKLIPLILSIYSMLVTFFIYTTLNTILDYSKFYFKDLIYFLNQKWYFDKLINYYFTANLFKLSYTYFFKLFDKGFLEFIGPYGITKLLYKTIHKVGNLQSGLLYHYIGIVLNVLIYFFLFFFMYFNLI